MAGKGGPHFKGRKHSAESRAKIGAAQKGRKHSKEHIENQAATMRGKPKTKAHAAAVSKALTGIPCSEKRKKEIGDFFRGKSLSENHKMKIGLGNSRAIQEGRSKVGTNGIHGFYDSAKNKKQIHYRSHLELHWYQLLESMAKVVAYEAEPVIIPYEFEGKIRHYTPDILITYSDGSLELAEVKPESRWNEPLNVAKWNAAKEWCLERSPSPVFRVVGFEGLEVHSG